LLSFSLSSRADCLPLPFSFRLQVDFGGSLPANIVALVARTSPLALAMARKILNGEAVPKSKQPAA